MAFKPPGRSRAGQCRGMKLAELISHQGYKQDDGISGKAEAGRVGKDSGRIELADGKNNCRWTLLGELFALILPTHRYTVRREEFPLRRRCAPAIQCTRHGHSKDKCRDCPPFAIGGAGLRDAVVRAAFLTHRNALPNPSSIRPHRISRASTIPSRTRLVKLLTSVNRQVGDPEVILVRVAVYRKPSGGFIRACYGFQDLELPVAAPNGVRRPGTLRAVGAHGAATAANGVSPATRARASVSAVIRGGLAFGFLRLSHPGVARG